MIGPELFVQIGPTLTLVLWTLLLVYALLGKPLFAVLGSVGLLLHLGAGLRLEVIFAKIATVVDNPIFVTIPLFVFAGTLLSESQAAARLVRLARALLGWLPGGLAIVATVCCAFFTAVTGASGVTIVALGGLLYPVLKNERYPERFSVGLLTTGGSLGLLFVPSLPLIVYGLISGVPIDRLFLAGLVPGTVLVVVISVYSMWQGKRHGVPRHAPPWRGGREVWRALRGAAWEAPIPFLILGGIFSGKITAVEASAVTALYCLFVEVVVYRDIRVRDLWRTAQKTAELVGAILLILSMAMGVENYLIDAQIPQRILRAMSTHIQGRLTFLLVLNGFLLVTGMLLDIFSAILVVVPLIAPLAIQFGVDPVHLGIVFLTNLEIGYLTPPVGINLFLGSLRFERPVLWIARSIVPFVLLLVGCLAAITYVPALSLGAIDLVHGPPSNAPVDRVLPGGTRVAYEQRVGRDGRGVKHGRFRAWTPAGALKEEGRYVFGNRYTLPSADDPSGFEPVPWRSYYPGGQRKAEGHYRLDRKEGRWRTWYPDGTHKDEGAYRAGEKDGPWMEWNEDGQKFSEGTFRKGLRQGHWIDWAGDTQKLFEGECVDDKPDGVWKVWDEETGERLPDKHWRMGVEQK